MKVFILLIAITLGFFFYSFNVQPQFIKSLVFKERNGIVSVEAEHFYRQTKSDIRKWYVIDKDFENTITGAEPTHAAAASGKKYVECLPDTRITHDDKLIAGENFSNKAGEMAILHYRVYFNNPGRYFVWVRAYSTGTEDNGIHVGMNGEWPESGQRLQWCDGKNEWTWESKQRTQEEHCGVPEFIYLDIQEAGMHDIQFSMREDGFEFDKFVLTKTYQKPSEMGPDETFEN
jgi:hypothetical protein